MYFYTSAGRWWWWGILLTLSDPKLGTEWKKKKLYLLLASSLCRMFLALNEKAGRKGGKTTAITSKHTNTRGNFLKQKAENNCDSNSNSLE